MARDLLEDKGDPLEDDLNQVSLDSERVGYDDLLNQKPDDDEDSDEPDDDDDEDSDEPDDDEDSDEEEEPEGEPADEDEEIKISVPGIGEVDQAQITGAFQAQVRLAELEQQGAQMKQQQEEIRTGFAQLQDARQLQNILEYPAMRQIIVQAVTQGMKDPANLRGKDGKAGEFNALFRDPRVDALEPLANQMREVIAQAEISQGRQEIQDIHADFRQRFGSGYTPAVEQKIQNRAWELYKDTGDLGAREFRLVAQSVLAELGLQPASKGSPANKQIAKEKERIRLVRGRGNRRAAKPRMKDPLKMSEDEVRQAMVAGITGASPED